MPTFDFCSGPVPAHKHPNGGGWVADTASVAETAYVGPDAQVYGSAWVYGSAQVTRDPIVITGAIPYTITISDKHVQVGCVQVTKTALSKLTLEKAKKLHAEGQEYFKKVQRLVKDALGK